MIDKVLANTLNDAELEEQVKELIASFKETCSRNTDTFVEGFSKILQFPDLMGRQDSLKREAADYPQSDADHIEWHCYLCGQSWEGYTLINPEIPDYCAKCKKPGWNNPANIGKHDPKCNKCLEKAEQLLKKINVDRLIELLNNPDNTK